MCKDEGGRAERTDAQQRERDKTTHDRPPPDPPRSLSDERFAKHYTGLESWSNTPRNGFGGIFFSPLRPRASRIGVRGVESTANMSRGCGDVDRLRSLFIGSEFVRSALQMRSDEEMVQLGKTVPKGNVNDA